MAGEQFAIGRLEERATAQGEDRRPRQTGKYAMEMMMLDGAEAAFSTRGKQPGDLAVNALDLLIKIDQGAAKPTGEKASEGGLSSPHETDEDQ
jgi:hypothetical protein